jgi:integrase/recombinase XerD
MTAWGEALADYLSVRRALGFKLEHAGRYLAQFVTYLEDHSVDRVTVDHALAWATQPSCGAAWQAQRLAMVRGFAVYLRGVDPATEVPPARLLSPRPCRATPYLYAEAEISALIQAATVLPFPLQMATYQTLIGLLAATGMRIGEVIALNREDLDTGHGLLTVRDAKYGKTRLLPLHPSVTAALVDYVQLRDRLHPVLDDASPALFISQRGTRLLYPQVRCTFLRIVEHADLKARSMSRRANLHGLRHSFAVATLLGWYRDGADVPALLPRLSTYLGHTNPRDTFWYLSASPELLALAGQRLDIYLGDRS